MLRRKKTSAAAVAPPAESNLEDTDSENPPDEVNPRFAGDANEDPPKVSPYPAAWGSVIHSVFDLDIQKTYKRLNDDLTLGDGATEYGTVLHAVDAASRNLFDATRLARKAQLEDETFGRKLDQELEVYRSAAVEALVLEQKQGSRTKAPTLEDIRNRMIASFPTEVNSLQSRKAEMHGAFRAIQGLVDAWTVRCRLLSTIAEGFKRAGTN